MSLLLNLIWFGFAGVWLALGYLLVAALCFILIITIPFGFAALRISGYAVWPFGRTVCAGTMRGAARCSATSSGWSRSVGG